VAAVNLATIEMEKGAAAAAVRSYRAAVRVARPLREDLAALRGYRQLARGRRLISLEAAIAAGGTLAYEHREWNGAMRTYALPKIAVCDATAERCIYHGSHFSADQEVNVRSGGLVGRWWVRNPAAGSGWHPTVTTIVPTVPPDLRPAGGLGGYHILWEVESWQAAQPPRDPALLKWIGGDLWAVLAVWDLTELERLILKGRAR
jgi:hypothetical protein